METVTTMVTENFESPALESLPFEELCYDDDPGFPKSDISKLIQANLAVSFYFIHTNFKKKYNWVILFNSCVNMKNVEKKIAKYPFIN